MNDIDPYLKNAVYKYCRLRGLDPEQTVGSSPPPNPDGSVNMVLLHVPQWTVVARELKEHALRNIALNVGSPQ